MYYPSRQIPHLDEFKGEKLRLRSFTLMELPEAVFSLTQLTTLNAYNNCLETIPPTITQLVSLKKLQLAQNSLTCIPSFKDMPALSLLSLSHNQLGALFASIADSTAFWPPSLTDLQLDDNHIVSLPDIFANLSSLTGLSVRSNDIVTLPPSFFTLTALQHLVIAQNQIQELRIDGGLSSLTTFDLAENKLTRLSLNLPSLRNLYIQDNQISTLGSEIASMPSLEFFSAQNNKIETIAPEIGQLSHLSFLSLCNNRLTTFPLSLALLSSLTLLDLSDNSINEIPEAIGHMTSLETLMVHRNKIARVPSTISCLQKLSVLAMDSNQITTLPKEIGSLAHLQELYCHLNPLASFPSEIFKLKELTMWTLQSTNVTELPWEIQNMSRITTFVLPDALQDPKLKGPAYRFNNEPNSLLDLASQFVEDLVKRRLVPVGYLDMLPEELQERLRHGWTKCVTCHKRIYGHPPVTGRKAGKVASRFVWLSVRYCSMACTPLPRIDKVK